MPSSAELHSKFSSFPTSEHVQGVCKPGQGAETCRYLTLGGGDTLYQCLKATLFREALDRRVEQGDLGARGDNCSGMLGFIMDNQNLLMGNRVVHHEDGKDTEMTFDGIIRENGIIWVAGFGLNEKFANLTIASDGIVFNVPYLGFAKIFFEKSR